MKDPILPVTITPGSAAGQHITLPAAPIPARAVPEHHTTTDPPRQPQGAILPRHIHLQGPRRQPGYSTQLLHAAAAVHPTPRAAGAAAHHTRVAGAATAQAVHTHQAEAAAQVHPHPGLPPHPHLPPPRAAEAHQAEDDKQELLK